MLAPRWWCAVQPDDGRFGLQDPTVDVEALRARGRVGVRGVHIVIAIAEHRAARDVPLPGLEEQGLMRAVPCLVAFHLGGEPGDGQQHLVDGRGERDGLAGRGLDDTHPGPRELLQEIGGLDLLAASRSLSVTSTRWKGTGRRARAASSAWRAAARRRREAACRLRGSLPLQRVSASSRTTS
jgi:hypothetical protein